MITGTISVTSPEDGASASSDPGFHPTLPSRSVPLKNGGGVTVKTFTQLDPQVRSDIKTFIGTAVARRNLGTSWDVVSPTLKRGYTPKQWAHGAEKGVSTRPVTFQLGLVRGPKGSAHPWVVDYWMPRWTPPVPAGQ